MCFGGVDCRLGVDEAKGVSESVGWAGEERRWALGGRGGGGCTAGCGGKSRSRAPRYRKRTRQLTKGTYKPVLCRKLPKVATCLNQMISDTKHTTQRKVLSV